MYYYMYNLYQRTYVGIHTFTKNDPYIILRELKLNDSFLNKPIKITLRFMFYIIGHPKMGQMREYNIVSYVYKGPTKFYVKINLEDYTFEEGEGLSIIIYDEKNKSIEFKEEEDSLPMFCLLTYN